jgi:hypothetical protein
MTLAALDSFTLVIWILQEPRWQAVQALLQRPDI